MNFGPWLQSWLQGVAERLATKGYSRFDPTVYDPLGIKYAARRTRPGALGLGSVDDFFILAVIEELDAARLHDFSSYSFQFADSNTDGVRGFFLNLLCYPVAVTEKLDPRLAKQVQQTAPPIHRDAVVMPTVFDLATGQFAYFRGTSLWTLGYGDEMRGEIETTLR